MNIRPTEKDPLRLVCGQATVALISARDVSSSEVLQLSALVSSPSKSTANDQGSSDDMFKIHMRIDDAFLTMRITISKFRLASALPSPCRSAKSTQKVLDASESVQRRAKVKRCACSWKSCDRIVTIFRKSKGWPRSVVWSTVCSGQYCTGAPSYGSSGPDGSRAPAGLFLGSSWATHSGQVVAQIEVPRRSRAVAIVSGCLLKPAPSPGVCRGRLKLWSSGAVWASVHWSTEASPQP